MASVNPLLSPLTQGETMRDYKHGSRTFVDNNFELQPRYSNLFHVVFEFTPEAATLFDTVEQLEMPLLVKSIDLPTYSMDVQTHNQYNRKVQSHHSFNYTPVNVVFHDDNKELIRNMWHKYYIFYNADPTYDLSTNAYTAYDKYSDRVQQQWGIQRGNKRFFKNIKIYSMHNHKFAEYTLINPIITAFNHDTHAYANGGLMQHTMQLAYETVKYATGFVNDINPRGFGDIHYDVETSDLSDHLDDNQAFVNGSLQDVQGTASKDLFQGNLIGVIKDADIVYNQTKPQTGASILQDTVGIVLNNALTGKKLTSNILVPVTGKVEEVFANVSGGITDGIINTVGDYLPNTPTSRTPGYNGAVKLDNGVIKTQGQVVQVVNATPEAAEPVDRGNATRVPSKDGTASNASKISDTNNVVQTTSQSNTKKREGYNQDTFGFETDAP